MSWLGRRAPKPKVLFVTVDPETDTPAVIGDFTNQFGVAVGLAGTKEQLVDVQRQFSKALVALAAARGTPEGLGHDGQYSLSPDGLGNQLLPATSDYLDSRPA